MSERCKAFFMMLTDVLTQSTVVVFCMIIMQPDPDPASTKELVESCARRNKRSNL